VQTRIEANQTKVVTIKLETTTKYPTHFTVVDSSTSSTVEGANIELTDESNGILYSGQTDSTGTCDLQLVDHTFSIDVTKTGFLNYEGSVTITSDGENNFIISITPVIQATFHVRDIATTNAIGSALVHVKNESNDDEYAALADDDGNCSLGLAGGTYTLKVSAVGYADNEQTIIIATNTTNSFTIDLDQPIVETSFAIRDASELTPINGATVQLINNTTGVVTNGTTAGLGVFEPDLKTGSYTLEVSNTNYVTHSEQIMIMAEGPNSFTVDLAPIVASSVTVMDFVSHTVITGALVRFVNGGQETTGTTNSSGVFSVNLAAGFYTLEVLNTGYIAHSEPVVIAPSSDNDFTVNLTPDFKLATFTVRDSSTHNIITGALVQLTYSVTGSDTTGTTNSSGQYQPSLQTGPYAIQVSKSGYDTYTGVSPITITSDGANSFTIDLVAAPTFGAIQVYVRAHWRFHGTDYYWPLGGTWIRVTCSSPAYDTQLATGFDGKALFSNLQPGAYTTYRWSGGWIDSRSITVTSNNTSNCTYTIEW
jgi:hypothetical protein